MAPAFGPVVELHWRIAPPWETFSAGVSYVWGGITNPYSVSPFTSYDPMGNYTGY